MWTLQNKCEFIRLKYKTYKLKSIFTYQSVKVYKLR